LCHFKDRLIRDAGCQAFSSKHDNLELFWLCFLGPQHMSRTIFVRIKSEDFMRLWDGELKMDELYNMYYLQSPDQEHSDSIAKEYKLRDALALHKLPSIVEMAYAKSEI
jgi:hypothetical protein